MSKISVNMVGKKRVKRKSKGKRKVGSKSVSQHRAGKVRAPISKGKWA